jgi:hypothetical protein
MIAVTITRDELVRQERSGARRLGCRSPRSVLPGIAPAARTP